MTNSENILVLVGDGEHGRLLRFVPGKGLHTEAELKSDAAHMRDSALVSDRPGAAFHSDSSAHHALTPRHDPHDQAKHAFARRMAQDVNALCRASSVDRLVIVAPDHVLHDIRAALAPEAAALLAGTVAKDLVKTPDHELWAHVREWVPAVHRPA